MSTQRKILRAPGESVSSCRHHGGTSPRDFLDFSAPLNPLGTPKVIKELIRESVARGDYSKYPDYLYRRLRESIASFYGLESEFVIPLNGGSEALYIITLSLRPDSLAVFEPTFGDHRCLVEALNIELVSIPYVERGGHYEFPMSCLDGLKKASGPNTILLLSNPNNPTGAMLPVKQLTELLDTVGSSAVVIDEAFFELCHSCGSVSALKLARSYENLIVVRSLTKTYSTPGLRIGFLYTENRGFLNAIESSRAPWNINSIAEAVFSEALENHSSELKSFIEVSQAVVREESRYLEHSLKSLGVHVYTSTAPFLLVKHSAPTSEVLKKLCECKVFIRDASTYPYLTQYHARISVRLRDENEVLIRAYEKVVRDGASSRS